MFFKSNLVTFIIVLTYFGLSILIFNNVFFTSKIVIDELYHLPQGLLYCRGNFTHWDPKITTLPGLYIISTVLLYPLQLCSTYYLRFINLLASTLNLYLLIGLFQNGKEKCSLQKAFHGAFNLAILPPLYFFSHLYYTDTISLSTILLMLTFKQKNEHFKSALCGSLSILLRQTNVIWVGFCLGETILTTIFNNALVEINDKAIVKEKRRTRHAFKEGNLLDTLVHAKSLTCTIIRDRSIIYRIFKNIYNNLKWQSVIFYVGVIFSFILFIYINGSIVVGDKTAHTAAIHLPQIFYFSLFFAVFGAPFAVNKMRVTVSNFIKNPKTTILVAILFTLIIYFNTIVHPYLLADNRHYTFYIWNRLLSKTYFKYGFVIIYLFSLQSIYNNILGSSLSFRLVFTLCVFVAIALQKMIEVRYFLIPFVLLRLNLKTKRWMLYWESLLYIIINVLTFYIFFTKVIYWNDFEDVQRLIW